MTCLSSLYIYLHCSLSQDMNIYQVSLCLGTPGTWRHTHPGHEDTHSGHEDRHPRHEDTHPGYEDKHPGHEMTPQGLPNQQFLKYLRSNNWHAPTCDDQTGDMRVHFDPQAHDTYLFHILSIYMSVYIIYIYACVKQYKYALYKMYILIYYSMLKNIMYTLNTYMHYIHII